MKRFWGFIKGILLEGESSDPSDNLAGSLWYNSTDEKFKGYAESDVREIVTDDQTQTLSNKTMDNSNIITLQDNNFTLQDDGDNTKQAQFQLSDITTATTRTYTLPDANITVVGTDNTQTLENKTIDGTSATGNNTVLTDADDVSYDNTTSSLVATDVQAAIDEVEGRVDTVETDKLEGPGTHGDNVVLRTDGINTNVMQTSGVVIDDSNDVTGVNNLTTTGDVIVGGDLTVNGTTTTINTAILDVEDTNITVNKNGNDASSEGAGLTVERTGTNGSFVYEDALVSKFKIGALGSEVEVADVSSTQTITNKDMGDDSNVITNASADSFTRESGNQQIVTIPDTVSPDNFVLENFEQILTNKDYDGGTASNNSRLTVPKDTKANLDLLTRKEATLVYAEDQDKLYVDNGTKLTPIGSGGELNFYEEGDAEIANANDFSTGNNATFDGGGTLAGTFSITNTAADLIRGDASFKYVQSAIAGDNDDDYIATPAIPIPQGYRGRSLLVKFQYRTNASDDNIKVVVKDNTNSVILSSESDLLKQYNDSTNNTGKEFQLIFYCPADCEEIKFGFQVITGEANAELVWDDVVVTPNLSSTVNGLLINQHIYHSANGSTLLNAINELRFNLANFTSTGNSIIKIEDDSVGTRTKFIALQKSLVNIAYSHTSSAGNKVEIRLNGSAFQHDTRSDNRQQVVSSLIMNAGDFITILSTNTVTPGSIVQLSITAQAEVDHVITPAKSNMSDWTDYTPTLTGFGTPTINYAKYRRIGSDLLIRISFVAGTVSATEGQLTLPVVDGSQLTVDGDDIQVAGMWLRGAVGATQHGGGILVTPGDTFINFTNDSVFGDGPINAINPANGDEILSTGETMLLDARIPIVGWDSNAVFLAAIPVQKTVYLKDVKPPNTDGGTFTAGVWQTRTLNTVSGDTSIVSLSANQFTLGPGTYEIEVEAPAFMVGKHKTRLRNMTDSADEIIGSSEFTTNASATAVTLSKIMGQLVITTPKTYEIQHRGTSSKATNGFGNQATAGVDEIYTQVKITKVK